MQKQKQECWKYLQFDCPNYKINQSILAKFSFCFIVFQLLHGWTALPNLNFKVKHNTLWPESIIFVQKCMKHQAYFSFRAYSLALVWWKFVTFYTSFSQLQDSRTFEIQCWDFIDFKKCGRSNFPSHQHMTGKKLIWSQLKSVKIWFIASKFPKMLLLLFHTSIDYFLDIKSRLTFLTFYFFENNLKYPAIVFYDAF